MKLEFRQRLLASTLLVGAAAFGSPAFAQSGGNQESPEVTADVGDPAARLCADNPTAPECEAQGRAIVVTGSRIASPTLTSASPLQIVDSADIDASGVVNVQEVLLENPAFGVPTISRTNSNFQTASVGVATVDLRNLGIDRTLVLVNGRRFTPGIAGSAAVDLNTIPTQFIERIDILTGGASSLYGSDAVAGVVNIIYKNDFEGVELNGQIGISERGDDSRKQANLLMGSNFADGRGNVTLHLGYSDEGAVFTRNRKRSAVDQISCYFFTGEADDLFRACRPFLSSFNPQGTFSSGGGSRTFDPLNGQVRTASTNGPGGTSTTPGFTNLTGLETGFNRSAFRTIAVPTERYLVAFRGNYEVGSGISVFTEATYAKTSTVAQLEPFPFQTSGTNGTHPATGGRFNIEQDVVIAGTGPLPTPATNPFVTSCVEATRTCRVLNPFVPAGILAITTDVASDPDNFRDLAFTQRLSSFGNRGATADRNTYRVLAGLEGSVFGDWGWDAYYAFGETTEAQISGGQVNLLNFANALNVIADVNDLNGNGSTTDAICASAQARAQGCVPANVFGAGLLSPGAVNYIRAPAFFNTKIQQKLAGANLNGTLFDLWGAGPVGLAVGAEYRKESSEARSDALTIAGLNGGNARPDTEGSFDVVEGYAEIAIPLLSDVPFFHMLEARGAIRVSDYSTVGTTYSYNAGLEWAPVPDIRFRAVYARATRAPNIGELFTAPSQTFPPGIVDPCVGVGPTGGGTLGEQCRAAPGVLANIAANGVFTQNQSDQQGIGGFNSGNPNLTEEKSDSYTLGVVVNPTSISWLRNFAFTADYFNIKIEDAIVGTPRQFILTQCYVEGNNDFCSPTFIVRRPEAEGPNSAGSIRLINSFQTNSGGLKAEGLDFTFSYRQNLENWGLAGNVNARVAWTHFLEGFSIPLPGSDKNPFDRELGQPRNRVSGNLSYTLGDVTATVRAQYIGPQFLDDQFVNQFLDADGNFPDGFSKDSFRIGAQTYIDTQIRFTPGDIYEFYVGVDNLFDRDPPLIPTGLPGGDTGVESNASSFDVIGRRFYAGATLRF